MNLEVTSLFDLAHTQSADYLSAFRYPWEALDGIKQMILEKYPEFEEDTAMNVMLSFCIQGSYHAYQKNRSGDIMTVIDVIAGMTGAVRPMYEERLGESRS